ncbi:MAG TPA: Crp/Fnr family transcriptional regulator [Terriglobales bacterium]|nr:Crp/Fnr family transcriptional regulator [Terriglobales bacterium]
MLSDQVDRVLSQAVFRSLACDRLRSCVQPLHVREYAAGETVAEPSRRRPALHLLLSGRLRVFEVSGTGRRIVLDYIEPGGIDGLLTMAGLRGHFTEAVLPSEVVTITRPAFDDMIAAEPRLAVNLLWIMSRRLRRREDQVTRLMLRDPGQRIAAQLLALSDRADGQQVEAWSPRLSHEALADLLGLRRETVTLHLARLRRMGALRVEERRFHLDVRLLEAIRDGSRATQPAADPM